jgi:hypothetical protein
MRMIADVSATKGDAFMALSLVAGPSCQFSRTIDRIAARTEDKLSLRAALLSGNHGK